MTLNLLIVDKFRYCSEDQLFQAWGTDLSQNLIWKGTRALQGIQELYREGRSFTGNPGVFLERHRNLQKIQGCFWKDTGIYRKSRGVSGKAQEFTENPGVFLERHRNLQKVQGCFWKDTGIYRKSRGISGKEEEFTGNPGVFLERKRNLQGIQGYFWKGRGIHRKSRIFLEETSLGDINQAATTAAIQQRHLWEISTKLLIPQGYSAKLPLGYIDRTEVYQRYPTDLSGSVSGSELYL